MKEDDTLYYIFFSLAILILLLSVILSVVVNLASRKRKWANPFYILAASVFLAAVLALFPLNLADFQGQKAAVFSSLLTSIHSAIRMYVVDCDLSFFIELAEGSGAIEWAYVLLFNVLLLVAPALTFGLALSFFANVSARFRYLLSFFRDAKLH